jgi:C-terminal processing protease CtpA/Prc
VRAPRAALLALAVAGCGGGSATGVGALFSKDPGSVGAVFGRDRETRALVVREAPSGGGAEKAGIEPGDEVVMIDGFYVKDLNAKEIRQKLRGEVGTTVRLTIVRGADEVRHVEVRRGALGEHHPAPPREERITE